MTPHALNASCGNASLTLPQNYFKLMEKLPANVGWLWLKEGFALYRKQPAELSTLFLSYMFLMLVVGIIHVVGKMIPVILVPTFSMAFMQACVHIEQGKRVYPNLLLNGFRSPNFHA